MNTIPKTIYLNKGSVELNVDAPLRLVSVPKAQDLIGKTISIDAALSIKNETLSSQASNSGVFLEAEGHSGYYNILSSITLSANRNYYYLKNISYTVYDNGDGTVSLYPSITGVPKSISYSYLATPLVDIIVLPYNVPINFYIYSSNDSLVTVCQLLKVELYDSENGVYKLPAPINYTHSSGTKYIPVTPLGTQISDYAGKTLDVTCNFIMNGNAATGSILNFYLGFNPQGSTNAVLNQQGTSININTTSRRWIVPIDLDGKPIPQLPGLVAYNQGSFQERTTVNTYTIPSPTQPLEIFFMHGTIGDADITITDILVALR